MTWCWHKWPRWSDVATSKDGIAAQIRICEKCNKAQYYVVKITR